MKMLIKNQKNQKNQQNLKNHKNPPNLKKKGPLRILRIHKREGYSDSEDFTDSQDEYYEDENSESFMDDVYYPFRDFDRNLAHIVDQVDDHTFQTRFCETDSIVTCYLSHGLFPRPLVGGLVRLEYNSGLRPRVHYIIEVIYSKMKEGSPWVWNTVLAEIIGEYEEMDERILYVRLEPGQVVPCKMFDHLVDTFIRDGDIVLLEVNETNRSFYYIVEIIDPYDS